ncbi:ATP-binding cassette domain-containing protein [Rhodoligotrophos defluvii]|uniref:ATP-binding cassette domain-containing protein n=1 Tax=Rhodoligotrophos defluvii TaxID=2561934 RepID=UPI0010CA0F48|nr:ATP-binding cassette domain-containing protein [Rhodoligotrophos defluvii]
MDITLKDVSKHFGRNAVLEGINIGFRAGEVAALLGPSGSGKTTLLNIIAGRVPASSGSVITGRGAM